MNYALLRWQKATALYVDKESGAEKWEVPGDMFHIDDLLPSHHVNVYI